MGEPWNQQAVFKGIGVPVITDYQLWKNNPEKVFGITAEFAEEYPNTTLAIVKALIRAAIWLDENDNANRPEAVEILSRSEYVGADYAVRCRAWRCDLRGYKARSFPATGSRIRCTRPACRVGR